MSAELVEAAALALGPITSELVFLGGASVHLWITDPAAPPTRATEDVDVISEVTSLASYYSLGERLRERGFVEANDSEVICRWRHAETGILVDVMPQDEEVLGFSNRWYPTVIATATDLTLGNGMTICAATPPSIVATKLAAWKGRGGGDALTSLDLHDIVVLVDGRAELAQEIDGSDGQLRNYVAGELEALIADRNLDYLLASALHGHGVLADERAARSEGDHGRNRRSRLTRCPLREGFAPDRKPLSS